jgi:hypothetical protein
VTSAFSNLNKPPNKDLQPTPNSLCSCFRVRLKPTLESGIRVKTYRILTSSFVPLL